MQFVKRVSKASDDASAKPQQVKKASKTQGNKIPQADEEAPRHPAPNVCTMANKSETSRTTANNPVSVVKESKPFSSMPKKKSLSKLKPDSITIKTTKRSLSGDDSQDQKEREEMLASPVKGSDAQTASKVSLITLIDSDCIFTSLFYIRPLSNLRRLVTKSPRIARKLSSCNLIKRTSLHGTTPWNPTTSSKIGRAHV